MKLYLVRHGEAVEGCRGISEASRYLSPSGRDAFRKTARRLKREGVSPDCIVTSPLVRAVQTAEILAQTLKYEGELVVAEELGPGFGLPQLESLRRRYGSSRELVLVGHEPDLGILAASLMATRECISLKKGAVLSLKLAPRDVKAPALLRWLLVGTKLKTDLAQIIHYEG